MSLNMLNPNMTNQQVDDFIALKMLQIEEAKALQAVRKAEAKFRECKKRKASLVLTAVRQRDKRKKREEKLEQLKMARKDLETQAKQLKSEEEQLKRRMKKSASKEEDFETKMAQHDEACKAADLELRKCGGDPANVRPETPFPEGLDAERPRPEVLKDPAKPSPEAEAASAASDSDEDEDYVPPDHKKCRECKKVLPFTIIHFTPTAMKDKNPRCANCDKGYRDQTEVKQRSRTNQAKRMNDKTCDSYRKKCQQNGIILWDYAHGKRLQRGEYLTGVSYRQYNNHIDEECKKHNRANPDGPQMTPANRGTGRHQWHRQSIVPYIMFCDAKTGFPDPNSEFPNLKSFESIVNWYKNQTVAWGHSSSGHQAQCTQEDKDLLVKEYREWKASESAKDDATTKNLADDYAKQDAMEEQEEVAPLAVICSSSRSVERKRQATPVTRFLLDLAK